MERSTGPAVGMFCKGKASTKPNRTKKNSLNLIFSESIFLQGKSTSKTKRQNGVGGTTKRHQKRPLSEHGTTSSASAKSVTLLSEVHPAKKQKHKDVSVPNRGNTEGGGPKENRNVSGRLLRVPLN